MNLQEILKRKQEKNPTKDIKTIEGEISSKEEKEYPDSEELTKRHEESLAAYKSAKPLPPVAKSTSIHSKEEKDNLLLVFLLLYYQGHARDLYIQYGEGARILLEWLEVFPPDYNPMDYPVSKYPFFQLNDQYLMYNIFNIHPRAAISILKNFFDSQNSKC